MVLRGKMFSVLAVSFLAVTAFSQRCRAQASITLSKKIGPPTSNLWVAGSGFQPNIGVDIYFDNKDEALAVTNEQGQFPRTQLSVPNTAAPGRHFVSAIGRNNGGAAQLRFIVNTDWSQTGFGPTQQNWNPYENVLNPGNVNRLGLLWFSYFGTYGYGPESSAPTTYRGRVYTSYVGGGLDEFDAFNEVTGAGEWYSNSAGSPAAISNGVAYAADEEYLVALNAANGTLLWKFALHDFNYPPAPPVVGDGIVFVGTHGGYFYALDKGTGELVWSASGRGGIGSAPAVGDGNVYFCASTCYAYYAPNGFSLWQYAAGGGATPAVSGSMVVVNGLQGTTALDHPNYGTVIWRYASSGSITAAAIANGVVYVTGKTEVLALDGATGSVLWHRPIGSGFSPAVADGVVFVSAGYPVEQLYALDAVSGKILWDYSVGSAYSIVSAPAVINGRLYITGVDFLGDGVLYAFGLRD
jgi:outer membrane protein assembly factor BamB